MQLGAARRQFKYGQLTNQIVPFVGERDISKEQGIAAGVLSPLLPPLPLLLRPTFVETPAMQANKSHNNSGRICSALHISYKARQELMSD